MSELKYGEAMLYTDFDTDLSAVRERLLDSILELPETCFFRATPTIISEEMFEEDEICHKAFYRCSPIEGLTEQVVGLKP